MPDPFTIRLLLVLFVAYVAWTFRAQEIVTLIWTGVGLGCALCLAALFMTIRTMLGWRRARRRAANAQARKTEAERAKAAAAVKHAEPARPEPAEPSVVFRWDARK